MASAAAYLAGKTANFSRAPETEDLIVASTIALGVSVLPSEKAACAITFSMCPGCLKVARTMTSSEKSTGEKSKKKNN